MTTQEIRKLFFEETGLVAKTVLQIFFDTWMIEAENGEKYFIN